MTPDRVMVKKIKEYDANLFVEWDHDKNLWALKRKAPTGQVFHIFYVQNQDGSFRPLDERVLEEIYECDIWKHFESPGDYHRFIQNKNATHKLKEENLRRDYLAWWNKEHKKEWKAALDNAARGILEIPNEPKPRVSIYYRKEEV